MNIPLLQGGGDRGPIARRGGAMSGILLRLPREALRAALRHPSDGCRSRAGGTVPVVYSLHDPRGLTSLRIRLSHQSILFHVHAL